ncbi:MAG TPA: dicarboxylate/amino acid:cation symporter [Cytophagaceae bacterium]|nr:dicarboxylate/amino acid:cation symporter [Cytophagaceae bacterium]
MSQGKQFFKHLYFYIILAIICGVLLGIYYPAIATDVKPLGDLFIKLIKMMIGPIIFVTVVTGIAGMRDLKKIGRVGLKALLYFEAVTTLALIIGLTVVKIVEPGKGMNIDPASLDSKSVEAYTSKAGEMNTTEFLLNIIPSNPADAFVKGEILQILFLAILFGAVLASMRETGKPVVKALEILSTVFFKIINVIMHVAPIGAFGAMAFTIGKYGLGSLLSLGKLMACVYLTCFFFIFIVLGLISFANGFSLWKFLKYIKEEIFIVLGTSSSESVLPRMIKKMEDAGCSKSVCGLVIPAGYSFNLDGTCIYLTIAALFIAQATNTQLTFSHELILLGVLLLTSKGAAAVTGGGFITLAATLASMGTIPVAGITLLLGVDRFMSEARAITNLIGNGIATIVVSNWEKDLDTEQLRKVLEGSQ